MISYQPMAIENNTLTYKKIFTFWYPLAASWLMMGIEGPFIAAVIARLAEPKFNLAAHGVAYSLALIIEAPIIMLMSASTALSKDGDAFRKLRRFTWVLNISITSVMVILIIPAVFYFIGEDLIGLPRNVTKLTHTAMMMLLPWPAAIGARRFYQGILIRYNLTRRITYGTLVRLFSMAASAMILYSFKVTGAYTGAVALATGVTCEAAAIRFMAHSAAKDLAQVQPAEEDTKKPITYTFITKFYYPLALMSILALGVHPMVTFFMGKGRLPLESLAVLPVINVLIFLFRSFGLSYQEVVIALLRDKNRDYIPLRNFAFFLGMAVTGGISLIAFTPAVKVWFHTISGLSLQLASLAYFPTRLLVFLPALAVLISFQRSVLVTIRNTVPISRATAIEVVMIIVVLYIAIIRFDMVGVIAAAMAYTIGRLCANLYLFPHQLRAIQATSI